MRSIVVVALVALMWAWQAPRAAIADIPFLNHHTVTGTIGTATTSMLTIVQPGGATPLVIYIPPETKLGTPALAGKKVTVTYKVNDQHQNVLIRIKEAH